MITIKVLPKGQITLPKKIRETLDIHPGDSIILLEDKNTHHVILKKAKTIFDIQGSLPKLEIPIDDMVEKSIGEEYSD
ncbi:MAG: hypothetical protein IEMM0008_0991 [bacterium]|nr:MAG: hypothetical protein IEMM0008_0991 [bacterium]